VTDRQQRPEGVRELVHELREPLTALAAIGELLDGDLRDDVLAVVSHMRGVISRFEIRPAEAAPVAIHPLVGRAARMVAASEKDLVIDIDCEPGLVSVADGDAVTQILVNLLANAARHSPKGVHVVVHGRRLGDRVVVDVCDGGPGVVIGEDAFLPGVSGDPDRSGIGLAVSRRLAEEMGGTLELGSQRGGGCLVLTLPSA
jgi:two-component system nitrogen regulation sensor histidine kinase GlnL